MSQPKLFTPSGLYLIKNENDYTLGLPEDMVKGLGDILYVDFPHALGVINKGDTIAVVESSKTLSDIVAPFDGQIVIINDDLKNDPQILQVSPEERGWLVRIIPKEEPKILISEEDYKAEN